MQSHRLVKIWTAVLTAAVLGLLAGATAGAYLSLTRDLPQIRELENFEPSAVTRIYSSDGVQLASLFLEKRTPIAIEQIPSDLITALIVTEDRRFFNHSGIDLRGILRALVKDIIARRFVEGASTITQQLAKTLFLTQEKTIVRKLREAVLAVQLERRYTKDELLALYLNQIYFGSGAYGVEAAAQLFFGKPASQMNLAQCALIAGLPRAPSRLSPLVNPDLALKRRNLVLHLMLNQELISQDQHDWAAAEPVAADMRAAASGSAPYFVQYLKPALEAIVGPDMLYKGGLTVKTTLSHRLQQAAEHAVISGLEALQNRIGSKADPTAAVPQAALVALEVKTGAILALVGGSNYRESAFNRAVTARRQPGSAFKPIFYALAVSRGFTQASLLLDAPVAFTGGGGQPVWQPRNFDGGYRGEMTLRHALTHSQNIPAVRLVEKLGPSAVVDFAHQLGISPPLPAHLSIALGTAETSLLELTSAFAVFPNAGNHTTPFGITEILSRNHSVIWQARPAIRAVMTGAQAAIMVDMLQGVIAEGTGNAAQRLTMPVGGKTGTSNDFRDALFVGFSPAVTAGVWVGRDDYRPLGGGETGARAALPIWIDFMAATQAEATAHSFAIPERMNRVVMDPATGSAAEAGGPGTVKALFINGTEPVRK